jgi:endoglucanase
MASYIRRSAMKKFVSVCVVSFLLCGFAAAVAQQFGGRRGGGQAPPVVRTHQWWNDGAGTFPVYTAGAKTLPLISVKGKSFVDPDGKTILFRGLCIGDPDKVDIQGHWNKELFEKVKEMGTMVCRIPVHPVAWHERGQADYLRLLDQAVQWCTELGMYVMLDWHTIGNVIGERLQDPMYDTTVLESNTFWDTMARHFAGHNTVAFYELFNEPAIDKPGERNRFGTVPWAEWRKVQEEQIRIIRARNPQAVVLCAGFDWAYDLRPVRDDPIKAENIGYTVHPYSNKEQQPWEPKWEVAFGYVADKYPVIATEFGGFAWPLPAAGAEQPAAPAGRGGRGGASNYGPSIINYLEGKGISWTVWCFDPNWGPQLLSDWNYTLNASGQFAKAAMHGEIPGQKKP